ncbi:uncharacterized protein G2W53_011467 [Senna tora]|uniref:Uncharacterized protein n=1 Tax=Senna tora TaxID=362788 RepID=A0A834X314_9FABA|nr:uncharacterized protein G2W53_011467 [Senna tora]
MALTICVGEASALERKQNMDSAH